MERYSDTVYRTAYTYLKSKHDAEDTVQEVFIKVIEKSPAFESDEHEKAWLVRVAINICKNKLKSPFKKHIVPIDEYKEHSAPEEEHNSHVLQAVLSLVPKYREVIYLYYYQGYSTDEIARILSKNSSTVRSNLARAREKLKSLLKEEYDFE